MECSTNLAAPIVPTQIDGSSPNSNIDPTRLTTPPNLAAQLSVTSSKTLNPTATTFKPKSNGSNSPQSTTSLPSSGTSCASGAISGSPPVPIRTSYGEVALLNNGQMSSDNPPSTRDQHNPRTLRKDSQSQSRDYKFCAFSDNDNQTEQEVGIPHGYQKYKTSKDMDRFKEKKRQKVVHVTVDSLNFFFVVENNHLVINITSLINVTYFYNIVTIHANNLGEPFIAHLENLYNIP